MFCLAGGEEPTTDCSDCVSQAQYDELYAMVEAQAQTIATLEASMANTAGLEATVNDIDQSLMDMATCMAGYASDTTDMPVDTEEPSTTMDMTTSMPTKTPTMAYEDIVLTYEERSDLHEMVCEDSEAPRTFKGTFAD